MQAPVWGFLAFEEQLCETWAVQPVGKGLHFTARFHPRGRCRGQVPTPSRLKCPQHKQCVLQTGQALQQKTDNEPSGKQPVDPVGHGNSSLENDQN